MPTPRKKPASNPSTEPKKPARKKAAPAAKTGVEPAAARRKRTTPTPAAAHGGNGDGPPPAGGRNFDLLIVESPAKAKTINKYLGPSFRVLASYGHVRDLAKRKVKGEEVAGIRIADGWKLRYVVDEDSGDEGGRGRRRSSKDILAELKREADRANRVLLASDPDREGEAIARDIADELNLDPARTYRVRFNEITKGAIQQALAHPEQINADRVAAQEARRAMDRVVGFPLSNLLGKKVAGGLSAGRVQSVAVKLVVDREREIEAFVTEEYWKITALLAPHGSGVVWAADPAKSKVFAKKKPGEAAAPGRERAGAAAEPEPDEPVEDTEDHEPPADAAPGEAAEAAPPAAAGKGGLPKPPPGAFLAELVKWDAADPKLGTEPAADAVVEALRGVPFVVARVEQKDRQDRPSPPFTTSTLQQQAFLRLRMSTSRTMSAAQALYQGVDLKGQGQTALITYMRTDSTRISPDALNAVRNFIGGAPQLGSPYLPAKPNVYASGKAAQEAHEAIRPTDVTITPTQAANMGLGGDQLRLYELIWRRFVASQCAPAVIAVTTYDIAAGRGLFRARGQVVKFPGYRRVLAPVGGQENVELPAVRERDVLDRLDLFETQHFTQPPPRYNQASLVKALEKEGIGRPSTYNTIISTIQKRGYVTEEKGRFFASQIGKVVTDLLVQAFPKVMDLKFTSHFEEELDEIETGKCHYREVLDEFWGPFSELLQKAGSELAPVREVLDEKCPKCGRPLERRYSAKTGGSFVGCTGWKEKENKCTYKRDAEGKEIAGPEVTDIPCPACGRFMVRKEGRFGVFFTCEGAPDCPTTMNLGADGRPVVTALPTKNRCPKCEKTNLLLKESKAGKKYVQCPDAKCKFIADADAQGNPVKPPDTGIACEKCGSPMVVKVAWRGPFLSCSGYPKCRNAKSINAELREQLTARGIELPAPPEKKEKAGSDVPQVEVTEKCPQCDGPMVLKPSRFGKGYFLSCAKYPKCKGTAKVTPELQARIDAASAPVQS